VIWMGFFWASRRVGEQRASRVNGRRVRRTIMSGDFPLG
jgi:hypothetical protein